VKVLVVAAHPVPASFSHAQRERAVRSLVAAGHDVETIDLYEGDAHDRAALDDAEALVFVHPTWYGGQPAIVKAWLDEVMDRPIRRVRRIAVVTTHGSPKWVNVLQGEPGKRIYGRHVRRLCARRARFRWVALYAIDRCDEGDRAAFLDRVARAMSSL
jgi:NAD(P)H dehydrogenase (quinone)